MRDLTRLDPVTHKLVCRVCTKPNALTVQTCTSCEFPLTPSDVDHVDPNPFRRIIEGQARPGLERSLGQRSESDTSCHAVGPQNLLPRR